MAKVLFALGMVILPGTLLHQIQLMVRPVMAQKWAGRRAEPAHVAESSADLSR